MAAAQDITTNEEQFSLDAFLNPPLVFVAAVAAARSAAILTAAVRFLCCGVRRGDFSLKCDLFWF